MQSDVMSLRSEKGRNLEGWFLPRSVCGPEGGAALMQCNSRSSSGSSGTSRTSQYPGDNQYSWRLAICGNFLGLKGSQKGEGNTLQRFVSADIAGDTTSECIARDALYTSLPSDFHAHAPSSLHSGGSPPFV